MAVAAAKATISSSTSSQKIKRRTPLIVWSL
jgi:hypothetical protein